MKKQSLKTISADSKKYIVPCYKRYPVAFVSGKGSILTDTEGKTYIDFFSGWAVSAVGHSHPSIAKAIAKQAVTLIHVPNNYYNALQSGLAKTIISASFPGKVFFCNSGAEAIEGAIKLARAYGGKKGKTDIITFNKSFHGRTTGAMSATAQAKYQKGMKPLLSGFKKAELNNIQSVKKAFSKKTAAILFEPIQGEGGVREASPEFMKWIRKFCDEHDILMMLDEVQTGIGRTGKLFCYQHYGIKPDVMLLAKSLGGGFPIGAIVASSKVENILQPGMHASTFGGSPLACAASLALFDVIKKEKLAARSAKLGAQLKARLTELQKLYPVISEVRGKGMMIAIDLKCDAQPVYDFCLNQGVLVNVTQGNIIRLAPCLNIKIKDFEKALKILTLAIKNISNTNEN